MIDIKARARKIKLLLLDVDGVLTDGRIVVSNSGEETKNFNVNDGLGIILLLRAGLQCSIITAKLSNLVKVRAEQLGIKKVYENHYKLESLESIKSEFGVKEEEICFAGDELIDLPILKRVGLAASVPDAPSEVQSHAHYITNKRGGYGAVRELCELILKSQGKWQGIVKRYFE
jgi:3-deoxy-D-manno-octulosonate 8-phosphate phosphatase (KDO 8-P phosphatase)